MFEGMDAADVTEQVDGERADVGSGSVAGEVGKELGHLVIELRAAVDKLKALDSAASQGAGRREDLLV